MNASFRNLMDQTNETERKVWTSSIEKEHSINKLDSITPGENEYAEPIENILSINRHRSDLSDADQPNAEIKGFKRDRNKRIICLDCGKCFSAKNSYNYHKRM